MADLGLYFGVDEDDIQLEQEEDKDLSYLVLSNDQNDQDDAFDNVDTETLLAEMSTEPNVSGDMDLNADADVVQIIASADISAVDKVRMLSKSAYDFHRSFLAREIVTILPEMNTYDAISLVIPVVREFSADSMESVRESLVSQLDKIILYFFQNALIVDELTLEQEQQDANSTWDLSRPPSIPHGVFTPVFINLLLDQNTAIANETRNAIVSVAKNIPEKILESEILNGVIAGLERLYSSEGAIQEVHEDTSMQVDSGDQNGEAELGKLLVVLVLKSLANILGKERCTSFVLPTLERLAQQSPFYVRKEIVTALGVLCKFVDQDVVIHRLLPLYDVFAQDDTWHIRRACCTVLASFVSSLPVEMKTEKVEQIYNLFSVDVSRSVRSSIMEVLGEVIATFEEGKVPESLLNHFLSMGQQPMSEHELAVMCAFNFPAVISTAGRSKWEQMKPVYMKLAGTFRSPIRRSLACSLHEIARIIGPELADRDLALAFSDCLLAEDEVKEGVIGHVVEFISCLSPRCRSDALRDLYNAWTELERSSNWRLRDSLAGHLPALCEIAEGNDVLEYLMPLTVRACNDGVSTIRESGVMAFPALWEASARIGSFVYKPSSERAQRIDRYEGGVITGSFADGEDAEMEDVTEQLNEPSTDYAQNSTAGSSTTESSSIDNKSDEPTVKTTTIRDEVIRQTAEFATNGSFRSRVVAVQIIHYLLDHGITVEEFEEHFLSLLVDHLATDAVVNVRICVSRVVSLIIENGYYYDRPVSNRLQELLTRLQLDPDRDVRIFAGGPAELPKPKKKKKKSPKSKKNRKKEQSSLGGALHHGTTGRSQVSTISEEDEDAEDVQFLQGEGESNEDEDEDGDSDDDDDEDSDEDSSDDDNLDFLNSAKNKGISNKPRNRNSLGIGMKVMVGNKLTVSGKEIRKPKTSWDYVHGEIDEEEESEDGSGGIVNSFSAALGACKENLELPTNHWNQDDDDISDKEGSLFDAPRPPLEHDDDDEEEEEEHVRDRGVISKVIPYTADTANEASPLVVEMEEAGQDGSGEKVAVVVSGGDGVSGTTAVGALAGQESPIASNHGKGEIGLSSENTSQNALVLTTSPSRVSSAIPSSPSASSSQKPDSPLKSPIKSRVTVDAANTNAANRNGTMVNKGRSPEEEVLRVLNAKIGAGKKLHPALPPPLSITPPSAANKKMMMGFKDPGSPSYAAIVASGANSPHPTNSPRPSPLLTPRSGRSPPLSPMTTSASKFNSQ
ncbi:Serine/threonine-protein phosphatase 4 regulatory subunit 1 [Mortierella sp. GBA30]|nr:Serine/threonine-protein phosphatase 4 regulatory subunit 1 [Mortierella sp. GBA30]